MRASDQVLEWLDRGGHLGETTRTRDYGIEDVLGNTLGKDMTLDELSHYVANRRAREQYKDQATVFGEFCRLAMQSDEETSDWFERVLSEVPSQVHGRDHELAALAERLAEMSTTMSISPDRLARIAGGMLEDGWAEHEVRFALSTLGGGE